MTQIIAHRGNSVCAPENTLASFRSAIESGADLLELDVRLTADGEVCVCHDLDLHRLTGHALNVHATALATLRGLHVLPQQHPPTPETRIPSLESVLDTVGTQIRLYVEIKTDALDDGARRRLTERCLELIGPGETHVLASFDGEVVAWCLRAGHPTALIATEFAALGSLDRAIWQDLEALSLLHHSIDAETVSACRSASIPLWAWTPDTPEEWERLQGVGAETAWCTNDVAALKSWLDDREDRS